MNPTRSTHENRQRLCTNVALTVIAGFLAINTLGVREGSWLSQAQAQASVPPDDDESGRISAAEQRKQIINELRALSVRLERLETQLNRGLSVKVTEMPPIVIPAERK